MKTLQELWEENGCKPFDAVDNTGYKFHCVAIAPAGEFQAIGWNEGGSTYFSEKEPEWTLITPKKKLYAYLLKSLAGFGDFSYEKIFFENPDRVASDLIRAPQFDLEV